MSDMRRLLESMDKIAEAGPKGLQRRPEELMGYEMGGGGPGGGGGLGAGGAKVWRNPRTGQTSSMPPRGTTVAQPLPPGVTPSTAGAGRGTVNPPVPQVSKPAQAKPRIQRLPGETPAQAVARAQAATPKPSATTPAPTAAKPAPATNPVNPNVKPGGSKEAQAYQTQRQTQQQPTPASTTPSTAATDKTPTTRPTKPAKDSDSVGKTRPGGEKDLLGRKEPSFDKTDISPIMKDRGEPWRPPAPKPTSLKKPAAAVAAAGASLYPSKLGKDDMPTTSGSAGTTGQPSDTTVQPQVGGKEFEVDLVRPGADVPSASKIELPTVGPQGPDSPFWVMDIDDKEVSAPTTKPAAPSKTTVAQPVATDSGSGTAAGPGTGSSTQPGTGTGTGSRIGHNDDEETILRRLGYIKETTVQKLLNDFTKFVESSAKNKSKAK